MALGIAAPKYCKLLLGHSASLRGFSCSAFLCSTNVTTQNSSKPKVVILGVGWGGFRVAKDLDKQKYDVTIISPRYYVQPVLDLSTLINPSLQKSLPFYPFIAKHNCWNVGVQVK